MEKKTAVNKQAKLDQIAAEIVRNNVCPDLAKKAKHLVFGEGNPNARVVFIGEAPGKVEDETGRPFVGPSGQFLSVLLESIGLSREDVYITSILKYRPPNNRDPLPQEKTEFWPYLQAQLEVIAPKLVVTLGRHSTNCFLPGRQISKVHGKVHMAGKWKVLPLFHPALALYNSATRTMLIEDFAKIPHATEQSK